MMKPRWMLPAAGLHVWLALAAGAGFCAEDAIRTPSEQMRDALQKLNKAPETIGKSLQGVTDAARDKLQQTFGGNTKPESKTEPVDLRVPKAGADKVEAAPKALSRDPFRPMTMRTKLNSSARENLSPLERFDLGQLKIVGIVWDLKEPRAMIEDPAGLGYVVKVGTPIGNHDGKVKAIHRNQIIVEERYEDTYGARKPREITMGLSPE